MTITQNRTGKGLGAQWAAFGWLLGGFWRYTASFSQVAGRMDQDEFRQQIKAQLQTLPKEAAVAFAARVALPVLPLLARKRQGNQEVFWFWPQEKRAEHLFAMFAACNVAVLSGHGEKDLVTVARKAATAYAAAAAAERHYIIDSINADITLIISKQYSKNQFLTLPLWPNGLPKPFQSFLQDLATAAKTLDPGFAYWLDFYLDRLNGKAPAIAMLRQAALLPESIESQGAAQINAYLLQLRDKPDVKPLNRVRAIFIGYGEAGKTSLIRVLHNQEVCPQEKQTVGIDIHEWRVPDTAIQGHFWDFGGQVMVHATHQLFLREACLYVLVISARSEISATGQAEYWLEHVKNFGGNSAVIIVGNRADQADLNLDMGLLRQKYPNIVKYCPLSCTGAKTTHKSHYDDFYQEFCQQLRTLGTHQVMFTAPQFALLQALRDSKSSFLAKPDFDALCETNQVNLDEAQKRDFLLTTLDNLGVIIHFKQLPFVDGYVLNPRWLTYGIYTLMYAKRAHLSTREIVAILSKESVADDNGNVLTYSAAHCDLIMEAMREFKLCYCLPDQRDTLIIPALLAANQPELAVYKTDALAFELVFEVFLPRHIMPELIVTRHREIHHQTVWQTGVVLAASELQASALLQVDYQLRKLQIWVQGPDAKDYLVILRDDIQQILQRLTIDYKEFVALPASARTAAPTLRERASPREAEKAPYRQLLAMVARGQNDYVADSGNTYHVDQVLKTFISAATQAREIHQHFTQHIYGDRPHVVANHDDSKHVNITDSSTGDVVVADTIKNSFNQRLMAWLRKLTD